MPDSRLLWPILAPEMTDEQLRSVAETLREWAGVEPSDATVDDLHEATAHQRLYLEVLEKERVQRLNTAGVIDLASYRKA